MNYIKKYKEKKLSKEAIAAKKQEEHHNMLVAMGMATPKDKTNDNPKRFKFQPWGSTALANIMAHENDDLNIMVKKPIEYYLQQLIDDENDETLQEHEKIAFDPHFTWKVIPLLEKERYDLYKLIDQPGNLNAVAKHLTNKPYKNDINEDELLWVPPKKTQKKQKYIIESLLLYKNSFLIFFYDFFIFFFIFYSF